MITTCPEVASWQALLLGELAEGQQAELNAHLESCTACQQTLESLVASRESWSGAAEELQQTPFDPQGKLSQVMAQLKARTAQGETQADGGAGSGVDLSYLPPSSIAGHLGRLKHYEILQVVGKGGFGTVFKVFDEKLQRIAAIKVLAPELAANATARRRFDREVKAAAAVKNEHVIAIHAVDDDHEPPFLVMEFVEGTSLQDKLDLCGPLEIKEILRIGMQIAEGLAAAHKQGLVHRDIKPANILLENGVQRVKITDFGLARLTDDASLTQSGVIAGTPMFMAPEQAAGETVDHRADLFSLGSVLYTMCTGRPPFRASGTMAVLKRVIEESPTAIREINSEVPDWLCAIIGKLQAKKPADRFATAKEVAELLGQHLAHLQQSGQAPAAPPVGGVAGAEALRSPGEPSRDAAEASKTQPRPPVEPRQWTIGDRVFAPWEEEWSYAARVHEIKGDSVHVWFDDGEIAWVKADDLRPLDIAAGSRVLGAWDQGWVYYPGVVTERDGDRVHIKYDDGDEEWTQLQYVCVPSGKAPVEPTKREVSPQEKALRTLRLPSYGLIFTGLLYWLTIPLLFVIRFAERLEPEVQRFVAGLPPDEFAFLWRALGVIPAVAGFVLIFGGAKMRRGEMYPLCLIAALLPLGLLGEKLFHLMDGQVAMSLGDWLALPFGTWALIVLTRRDVRAAFAGPAPDQPRRRTAPGGASAAAAIIVGGLLTGLLAALVIYHWQSNKLNSHWPTDIGLGVLAYTSFGLFLYWLFQRRDQQPGPVLRPPLELPAPRPPAQAEKDSRPLSPARLWWGAGLAAFAAELSLLGMTLRDDVWDLRKSMLTGHALLACVTLGLCVLVFLCRRAARQRGALRLAQLAILCGVLSGACAVAWVASALTRGGDQAAINITGVWESNWGPVTLEHSPLTGNSKVAVTGSYLSENDHKAIITKGKYDPAKSRLEFSFTETWINVTGSADLHLSSDGNKLEGTWSNSAGESGVWTMTRKAKGAPQPQVSADRWDQLYNGKNLDGWKLRLDGPKYVGIWEWGRADGALVCGGSNQILLSERPDFENFHLRVEAKVNDGGQGSFFFRSKFGAGLGSQNVLGYGISLASPIGDPKIGSLRRWDQTISFLHNEKSLVIPPDTWFSLETVAVDNRLKVSIDGKSLADVHYEAEPCLKGHLALKAHSDKTLIHVRKIEIKELPSRRPARQN